MSIKPLIVILLLSAVGAALFFSGDWESVDNLGGPTVSTSTRYAIIEAVQEKYLSKNGEYLQVARSDITLNSTNVKVKGLGNTKAFDMNVLPDNTDISVFNDNNDWGFRMRTEFTNRYEIYEHAIGGVISTGTIFKEAYLATSTGKILYLR